MPGLPISLQPSELARLAAVLAVAALLARSSPRDLQQPALLGRVMLGIGLPIGFLLLQPDLSGSVMLCAVVGVMLFSAGFSLRLLAIPAGLAALGVAVFVAIKPYALARVRGFLDPWQSADSDGFQTIQSFVAFGRGGIFGVGLGDGQPEALLPAEAHTDFILSVVAEELGLVGVLAVIGAFAALCFAGLRVARQARDPFALLLAVGCTAAISVPALCNAAVVMGLLPTTGLALPFLSHGSNSLVCTAARPGHPAAGGPGRQLPGFRNEGKPPQRRHQPAPVRRDPIPEAAMSPRRVWAIAGGGTGGHVTPALALAEAVAARGDGVFVLGGELGLERRLVPDAGFELVALPSGQVMGRGPVARVAALFAMLRGVVRAWRELGRRRASCLISVGGYASVPGVLAAALRRRPIALVEPNAMPGRANRLAARVARGLFLQFPEARELLAGPPGARSTGLRCAPAWCRPSAPHRRGGLRDARCGCWSSGAVRARASSTTPWWSWRRSSTRRPSPSSIRAARPTASGWPPPTPRPICPPGSWPSSPTCPPATPSTTWLCAAAGR